MRTPTRIAVLGAAAVAVWLVGRRALTGAARENTPAAAPEASFADRTPPDVAADRPQAAPRHPADAAKALVAAADDRAQAELRRLREPMAALFVAQEAVGPDAEARNQEAERKLFADPGASAALRARYAELPPDAKHERWKIVATLGHHPSQENVEFLRDVAVAAAAETSPEADAIVGRRAALGVTAAFAGETPGSSGALQDVLSGASPAAVQAAMIDLTSRDRLAPWHRQIAAARGLPTEYRRLSAEEEAAIVNVPAKTAGGRQLGPSDPVPPGK